MQWHLFNSDGFWWWIGTSRNTYFVLFLILTCLSNKQALWINIPAKTVKWALWHWECSSPCSAAAGKLWSSHGDTIPPHGALLQQDMLKAGIRENVIIGPLILCYKEWIQEAELTECWATPAHASSVQSSGKQPQQIFALIMWGRESSWPLELFKTIKTVRFPKKQRLNGNCKCILYENRNFI